MRKLILLVLVFVVACVTVRKLEIAPIDYEAAAPIVVETPVKAHLEDGSIVMFPLGITVQDGTVKGEGFKYDLTLQNREPVTELAVDDIAAMESYQAPVNKAATAGTSVVVAKLLAAMGQDDVDHPQRQ